MKKVFLIFPLIKKAILVTLGKLPSATGKAYTVSNVRKGFMLNGQLDIDSKLGPCMNNMVHTYRGDVNGTCLKDPEWLIRKFYSEMYENGVISKNSFDIYQIPKDSDFDGVEIDKDFTVSQENRQRAKVLSSKKQIQERRKLIYSKKMAQYQKDKSKFDAESKDYDLNKICEQKLFRMISKSMNHQDTATLNMASGSASTIPTSSSHPISSTFTDFDSVKSHISLDLLLSQKKYILSPEAKAFVRVRSNVEIVRGRLNYKDVPDRKEELLRKVVAMVMYPVKTRYYSIEPTAPTLATDINSDDDSNSEMESFDSILEDGTM